MRDDAAVLLQPAKQHAIGEGISEQLEIVPMQIRVIKHVRKVYGCRDCESAPVTADKPAQVIEKAWPARAFWRCC